MVSMIDEMRKSAFQNFLKVLMSTFRLLRPQEMYICCMKINILILKNFFEAWVQLNNALKETSKRGEED